jgi:hypothetical protein
MRMLRSGMGGVRSAFVQDPNTSGVHHISVISGSTRGIIFEHLQSSTHTMKIP